MTLTAPLDVKTLVHSPSSSSGTSTSTDGIVMLSASTSAPARITKDACVLLGPNSTIAFTNIWWDDAGRVNLIEDELSEHVSITLDASDMFRMAGVSRRMALMLMNWRGSADGGIGLSNRSSTAFCAKIKRATKD